MFPKLVALDTDGTIFTGRLDQEVWGKGFKAAQKLADNIHKVDDFTLEDRSNNDNKIRMNPDIPRIVTDILRNGASLAIVSRNTSKALCDRALYYFHADDPQTGESKSIIKYVRYDEVVDEPQSEHFKRIQGWSKYDYTDMVLFDDEAPKDVSDLGVVVVDCPTSTGLTWQSYEKGIARWTEKKQKKPPLKSTKTLSIAHFNDVYQVGEQQVKIADKQEKIDVTKFASLLTDITAKWDTRSDGKKDGLIVFSGDLFSPSTETSVTRGKHMPPIINALGVDVACAGNHEFDLGVPQLQKLIQETAFPWLLSNIVDENTGKVPETMKELYVLERAGVRIGFIGLVEEEWIATVTGWPVNYKWSDMTKVGKKLSAVLRDPAGEHKCDLVIAVTHSRIPNDIKLARELGALSPDGQKTTDINSLQGVDLLLGGHDHIYWISKGVTEWEGYDIQSPQDGAENDTGDTLIVKSGTDFQDLSEVVLELKDNPPGSVRNKVIQKITGKRHVTRENTPVNKFIKDIVDGELGTINAAMAEKILITEVQLDVRSSFIRLQESPIGNWIADCIRPAYDEALHHMPGYEQRNTDCVIACCGDFRGDGVYEPGYFTLKNLMTVLPYNDPTVVVELDANSLWDAMESGLSKWPTQEGRFPAISGMKVTWDSSRASGSRVLSIWLTAPDPKNPGVSVDKEEVKRTSTRTYLVMVGDYMYGGGDGYDVLKGKKQVITTESGQSKSALIRKFLLGAQYLNKKVTEKGVSGMATASNKTLEIVGDFKADFDKLPKFDLKSLPDLPSFKLPSLPSNFPTRESLTPSTSITSKISALNLKPTMPSMPSFGAPSSGKIPHPSIPHLSSIPSADTLLNAGISTIRWVATGMLLAAALAVADCEDMGLLDPYERVWARTVARRLREPNLATNTILRMNLSIRNLSDSTQDNQTIADAEDKKVDAADKEAEKTLPTICPVVDGRLKNVAK
ncbi:hypothetical protein D9757_006409 [Collybiopsis confluens]|uniref:Metallo-dependent phosphatase n=1 Tax=Collybiopsis confluens TaxID=2823264 RepID=A0A8H5HJ57_9AGAR|nr:hypothetical protein D9757_006409 [Collybiopsis confluens]